MDPVTIYARPTRLVGSHNMVIIPGYGDPTPPTTIPAAMAQLEGDGAGTAAWRAGTSYIGDPTITFLPFMAEVANLQTIPPEHSCYWEVGFHTWAPPPLGNDPW